jgi:hypothetical protein
VHLQREFQERWDQGFVDANEEHEQRHGQTKLLWSNLLGLALVEQDMQDKNDRRSIQLVVAGASPGTHMLLLLRYWSEWIDKRNVRMTLYDPAPLDPDLRQIVKNSNGAMKFEPRVFKESDAKAWVRAKEDDCLVFFSDIRSSIHGKKKHMRADEDKIADDMQAQKRWVKLMQPDYCMLKFHAPHKTRDKAQVHASIRYLHGVLYEQAYVGLFSAEYRLFCTSEDISQKHDHDFSTAAIEKHAFYHTKNTRPSTFSVESKAMPYDDAFAAHVAHKAAALLDFNAEALLGDARRMQRVAHMQFAWSRVREWAERVAQF